jgi:hypothetical protein
MRHKAKFDDKCKEIITLDDYKEKIIHGDGGLVVNNLSLIKRLLINGIK